MEKDVESFYDNVAEKYSDHDDRVCDKIVEYFILENLPEKKPLKILDAGGGIGRFSLPLIQLGHNVVLTDISKEMIKHAQKKLSKYNNIEFRKCSITDMSELKDNSFDVVLMMNAVLDYCRDYNSAMKETFRLLRKGGLFIGNVNNRFVYCLTHELIEGNYEKFLRSMQTGDRYIVWGNQKTGHPSHEFTLEELKSSLKENKFKIKDILGVFNLRNKYEMDTINDKETFIHLQIQFARNLTYINNSQDFLFIAKK